MAVSKQTIHYFCKFCSAKLFEIENTKGRQAKIELSIELFKEFDTPVGHALLLRRPRFYNIFIDKLKELCLEEPEHFRPLLNKFIDAPISNRTRSKTDEYTFRL